MKKLKFLGMASMAMMMGMTVASCGDDAVNGNSPQGEVEDSEKKDTPALTEAEQKAKLESTARTLMAKFTASDYKNFQYISDQLYDDNNTVVDDWYNAAMGACEVTTKASTTETISRLIKISNFASEFTLTSGKKWIQDKTANEVDYLQFTVTDTQGKKCVLKLTKSGNETPMHIDEFDTHKNEYTYSNGYSNYKRTEYKNTFYLPEHINITLTQDGTVISNVNLDFAAEIKSSTGEFNYDTDKLAVTLTAKVSDIDVTVNKVNYTGGIPATVDTYFKLAKNGETLIEASVNAKGTYNSSNPEKSVVNSATTVVSILSGEVRIESNATADFISFLNTAEDNKSNEKEFKSAVSKANGVINSKVYFSNSKNASASLRLESYSKKYSYTTTNSERWYYEPVIVFSDGTSYSSLQSYFDDTTYKNVIDRFEDLVDSFKNMFKKKSSSK